MASSLALSRITIRRYLERVLLARIAWPLPDGVDDAALEQRLFAPPPPPGHTRPLPDWAELHRELSSRATVTLQPLSAAQAADLLEVIGHRGQRPASARSTYESTSWGRSDGPRDAPTTAAPSCTITVTSYGRGSIRKSTSSGTWPVDVTCTSPRISEHQRARTL